jgi:hypothetical protein
MRVILAAWVIVLIPVRFLQLLFVPLPFMGSEAFHRLRCPFFFAPRFATGVPVVARGTLFTHTLSISA